MFWYKDTDPIKFLDKFEGQLSTHETENCLILSLLHRLGKNKQLFGLDSPRFWFSKESPTNIAIQTPPHNLILSYSFDLSRMDSFIDFLKAENIQIPGVIGEKTKVHQFAKKWAETNELKLNIEMNQRVYELRNVTSESLTHQYEIEFKTASIEHLDILLKWGYEFMEEAVSFERQSDWERFVLEQKANFIASIADSQFYLLFRDNVPVTMAKTPGRTTTGRVINYVYTPPKLRKNGYATYCVAMLSQKILSQGYKLCMLFTDLSNPTSNSIYQKIGYEPVIDMDVVRFSQT